MLTWHRARHGGRGRHRQVQDGPDPGTVGVPCLATLTQRYENLYCICAHRTPYRRTRYAITVRSSPSKASIRPKLPHLRLFRFRYQCLTDVVIDSPRLLRGPPASHTQGGAEESGRRRSAVAGPRRRRRRQEGLVLAEYLAV